MDVKNNKKLHLKQDNVAIPEVRLSAHDEEEELLEDSDTAIRGLDFTVAVPEIHLTNGKK